MKQTLFFAGLLFSIFSYGQRDVVASGGDAVGSTGSVSYSVGQIAYESIITNTLGSVYQGVQQPFEIVEVLTIPDIKSTFSATLYPNPAASSVILSLDLATSGTDLNYEVTDMNGKILREGKISNNETIIDVENFAQACYFVNIIEANKRIKSFKLLKNNQ